MTERRTAHFVHPARPRAKGWHRQPLLLLGAATVAAGIAACGNGADPGTRGTTLDDLPRLELLEELRIGSLEDPDYGFSRVGLVQVGPDGNVWVSEQQDLEIRVYAPGGELLRRMGRRGEGPGEFARAIARFGFGGDTVWAWENAVRRLTLFSLEGEVLSTARIEPLEAELYAADYVRQIDPGLSHGQGHLLGWQGNVRLGRMPPQRDTAHTPLVRFDLEGQVVDTVGHILSVRGPATVTVRAGRSEYVLPPPPRFHAMWVVTPDHLVAVDRDAEAAEGRGEVRLTRMTHAGDTIRSRAYAVRLRPFRPEYLDSLATSSAHQVGPLFVIRDDPPGVEQLERLPQDSAAARVAIRRQMAFPAFQPPVQATHLGADGALWLAREPTEGPGRPWVVFDAVDEPRGIVEVPAGVRIAWTEGDLVWAVASDEVGVPWLVRYRLLPGPGERP